MKLGKNKTKQKQTNKQQKNNTCTIDSTIAEEIVVHAKEPSCFIPNAPRHCLFKKQAMCYSHSNFE